MRKRLFLLAMAVLCLFTTEGATPDWKWMTQGSGTSVSGNAVATDADGNSYFTGNFQAFMTLGTTRTSLKASSVFITKYDNTGKLLWYKQADGTAYGAINSNAIAIDGKGNCYIAGSFTYTVLFDTTHLTTTGANNAVSDIFIAKYDKDGNFKWIQHPKHGTTSNYNFSASSITIDGNNKITVAGTGSYKMDFGNGVKVDGGFNSAFMVQYDADGNAQWAKQVWDKDGVGSFTGMSIAADSKGNLLLSGNGSGQKTDFGSGSTVNYAGGYFLAKYDNKGSYTWAITVYGPVVKGVSVDASGNPAIIGYMGTSVDFDKSTTVKSYGNYDLFTAKYDKDGNLKWVKNMGTTGEDKEATGITQDAGGNVFVLGSIGPDGKVGSYSLPSETKVASYPFVAAFDNSGDAQWLQNITLTTGKLFPGPAHFFGLSLDGSGNVFVVGNTAPSLSFGTYASSGYGVFIAEVGSGTAATPPAAPANLTASAHKKMGDGKIQLSWTDNSSNESGFIIWRSSDNTNWKAIDSTTANTTLYLDSSLDNSTKYYYKVTAYNSAGSSSESNVVSATTYDAIAPENIETVFSVYPNPSQGIFQVKLPGGEHTGLLIIRNELGEDICRTRINDGVQTITLPQNVKGLVFAELHTGTMVAIQKCLVKN